jgi:hypothetical protein
MADNCLIVPSFANELAFCFLEHNEPQPAVDFGATHGALA